MRIACYAQHLSGVGHFVRMAAIARGLGRAHEVHLVDGGRPLPDAADDGTLTRIPLPVLFRTDGALVAATGASVATVLGERARLLTSAVAAIRPEALIVDHFPFSKWELEGEIVAMITAARRSNPRALILCSLRDIAPRTRQEDLPDARYQERVLGLLHTHFDGILVHADPAFTRLEAHFARAADLPVPLYYTGFVVAESVVAPPAAAAAPYAVLSCGGGTRSLDFLLATMAAFQHTRAAGVTDTMRLRIFPGAFAGEREHGALRVAAAADPRCELVAFSRHFAAELRASALSISRAGYNTTVQLLQSPVSAVVVPDQGMSDQGPRAQRLADLGLAEIVTGDPLDVGTLAAAMTRALTQPRRPHAFRLDGVAETRTLLERLHRERNGSWPSTTTSTSPSTSR